MSIDEGYVKYRARWQPGPPGDATVTAELNRWRRQLFDAGLVGHYVEHDVGYGNISMRLSVSGTFVISGTQTGHLEETGGEHYSEVIAYDIDANTVDCRGPLQASSESLTHAALYELDSDIGAVVHVHSEPLWNAFREQLPTTRTSVAYGTPAMAREFRRLHAETEFSSGGIAIMGGHDEGLVSIGPTLESASRRVLDLQLGLATTNSQRNS